MFNKKDPLINAVQEVMKKNQSEREAVKLVNEKFGIQDRKALPHEKQGDWDAAYKKVLSEGVEALSEDELNDKGKGEKKKPKAYKHKTSGKEIMSMSHPGKEWDLVNEDLKGNQHKIDANKNGKVDSQDFKLLKKGVRPVAEEGDPSKAIRGDDVTGGSSVTTAKPTSVTPSDQAALTKKIQSIKEEEQIDEKAPPGAKYERMVKHIKAKLGKDGLTKKEKSIAYATAWKAKNKNVNEGFNNRHNLSITASDENQVVADQINEVAVNPALLNQNKKTAVAKKPIPTPFADRSNGKAPNRDPRSIAAKLKYQQSLATGKAKKVQPTGELKDGGNFYANKYKDKAETFARAATGDIGDVVGLTNPERGAALRKMNPGAAQAGDLAGAASMLLPGRGALSATTKAASTATKVEKGASIIPKIAKAEGQSNRLAARVGPGKGAGPWGAPTTTAAKTATTAAEKFKARANAMRRKVPGAEPKVTAKAAEAPKPTTATQTASAVEKVAPKTTAPNAAAANASRIRAAAGKAVNSTLNVGRLVAGPNGPSSGSSIGAPSTAAAATTSPTVKARQQLAAVGNQTGGVNNPSVAKPAAPAASTSAAPKPTAKPAKPAATSVSTKPAAKPAAPTAASRPAVKQDTSTPAQRAQFNRQIDKGNAAPGTQYKGLGVTTGKTTGSTVTQKPQAAAKAPVGTGRVK